MIETLSHPAQSAEFLSRRHDGELAADEAAAFEAHRLECAECQASVAEFENALAAYRSAPVPPHASDLSARILRKIRATSPSRRPFGVMFGIDVRWAGALAAALLVVIIGAPVFSRHEMRVPPATAAGAALLPDPRLCARRRGRAAGGEKRRVAIEVGFRKAASVRPEGRGRPALPAGGRFRGGARRLRIPVGRRDARRTRAATSSPRRMPTTPTSLTSPPSHRSASGAAEAAPPPPSLYAAAPAPAETKELARSNTARRRSASAPVGGEAGAGASADEAQVVVRLTIHPVDGEGEPPDVVQTPSDERLAAFRGRKYLLVVESGGRVVAVSERPAGGKLAKDKAREADPQTAARIQSLADTVLRELAFQPGDRPRRLVVDIR